MSTLQRTSHLVLPPCVGAIVALLVLLTAAPAGADPDAVFPIGENPLQIGHDQATDLFVIEHRVRIGGDSCRGRQLDVMSPTGELLWNTTDLVSCNWTIHEGALYVNGAAPYPAAPSTIRSYDMASGALNAYWEIPVDIQTHELFVSGNDLWFNHRSNVSDPSGIGHIELDDPTPPRLSLYSGGRILAASADGRFQWISLDADVMRIDLLNGHTVTARMDSHQLVGINDHFRLNADETLLYAAGEEIAVIDATTLEFIDRATPDYPVVRFVDLQNGEMLGVHPQNEGGVVSVYAHRTIDAVGIGPANANERAHAATATGTQLVVAVNDPHDYLDPNGRLKVEMHDLAPAIVEIDSPPIDAGRARTIEIELAWIAAAETITINGQPVTFRPVFERGLPTARLEIDLPALPAGSHHIVINSPLGQSPDTPANRITVEPAINRVSLDVVLRSDSAEGELRASGHCAATADATHKDLEFDVTLQTGNAVQLDAAVGHVCSVTFQRLTADDAPFYEARHLTTGFYDPARDATGTTALDIGRHEQNFTVPNQAVGLAAYLPEFETSVLWTYAYGFGAPYYDRQTPIRVRCGGEEVLRFETLYGYWTRSEIPRDTICSVHHSSPLHAETGFGTYDPEENRLNPPTRQSTARELQRGQTSYTLVVFDFHPHPSEDNAAFARQQYLDFLGRQGDDGGLRFWRDSLNSGERARVDLVKLFLDSPEFGGTVAPVNRLYQAYFDRPPDRDGLFFWVNWIRDGRTLGQVSDEFARSPEFDRMYGSLSDEAFIDLVYENVLDRRPDDGGRSFWVDRMNDGLTRGELMVAFSESPEFIDQTAAAVLVESLYQGLLQRSPDPEGFAFWTAQVKAGASIDSLITGMLASDEYYNRFTNLVSDPPSNGAALMLDIDTPPERLHISPQLDLGPSFELAPPLDS